MMDMNDAFAPLSPEEMSASARAAPKRGEKTPIVPVPADAPPLSFKLPPHGAPSRVWPYHDAEGRLVGYVCRWDFTDAEGSPAKNVLPVTYCDLGNGKAAWRAKGIPSPRPLFGLPAIVADPEPMVIVTEGEKARDAAAALFPDMVATTPAHGAKSPHLTDFTPLAGRTVVIATDNDDAGQAYGDKVCELARAAGAARVLHLPPERLGAWRWRDGEKALRGEALPAGYDLADALEEGWTAERVAEMRGDPGFLPLYRDAEERETLRRIEAGEPEEFTKWPFRVVSNGVEKRIERADKETGIVTIEWRWFCSFLEVLAKTRSSDGEEWGRLLKITDDDKRVKYWAMPMEMLAGDGTDYRKRLWSLGVKIAPSKFARDALHEYISTARPDTKARCVGRIGWHGKVYVLPSDTITAVESEERTILQTVGEADHAFREAGTLEGWQNGIARLAVGNSRLAFAMSAAFAAPLLYPAGAEGGGFHFRGASSTGKSTALVVAGSAWGGGGIRGPISTWRGTSNGLEGKAAMHCDAPMLLDEMGEIDGREAGAVAYMLANGVGKSRAGRSGEARKAAEWRLLFLSSGELSLDAKIAEGGRKVAAGQQVRIVDIPADAGAGHGLFEALHGFPSADAFARHLKMAAGEHYGHPTRGFLQTLVNNFDAIAPTVKGHVDEFIAENCPKNADGQVSRVAARFGLVAAGGEMATAAGVLPWPEGEATRAAARCFRDWLTARGGIEPAEEAEAIAAVRHFIELHGNSRFEAMGELAPRDGIGAPIDQRITNRVGFRRRAEGGGIEYLVLPESWKSEVCAGLDASAVAKVLNARGLLVAGGDGKPQVKTRLPNFISPVRCYVIPAGILGDAEPPTYAERDFG